MVKFFSLTPTANQIISIIGLTLHEDNSELILNGGKFYNYKSCHNDIMKTYKPPHRQHDRLPTGSTIASSQVARSPHHRQHDHLTTGSTITSPQAARSPHHRQHDRLPTGSTIASPQAARSPPHPRYTYSN